MNLEKSADWELNVRLFRGRRCEHFPCFVVILCRYVRSTHHDCEVHRDQLRVSPHRGPGSFGIDLVGMLGVDT